MTVVVLSDCPPKLRGDLSLWLIEISTGVYVGKINARVRDELWDRICSNLKNGRATMVYNTNNEQRMEFRVHNTTWMPVDYDGLKLVRRPLSNQPTAFADRKTELGFSKAAHQRMITRAQAACIKKQPNADYCVLDIETSGLDHNRDAIIEIGALRIRAGNVEKEYTALVNLELDRTLPEEIGRLSGLTEELLSEKGISEREALEKLNAFVGGDLLVFHNAVFDLKFLSAAYKRNALPELKNRVIDTLPLARRRLKGLRDYKLETLAQHFGLAKQEHRALSDCYLTYGIYVKLNEL